MQSETNASHGSIPAASASSSSSSSSSPSSSSSSPSAAATFVGASETLADEMSLCLTLLSKTTSHVFAIIEQLPDADAAGSADAADAAGSADALLEGAAQATSSLQETTVRLADMYVDAPPRVFKLQRNSCSMRHCNIMSRYASVEVNVMKGAVVRSWSDFDVVARGGAATAVAAAAAAAALAAVEGSAFIIGSSSVRALQTRCVMVAVVFMSRSSNAQQILPQTPYAHQQRCGRS